MSSTDSNAPDTTPTIYEPDEVLERDLDVALWIHQAAVVGDDISPVVVLEGGLGCGKTFTLLVKMLRLVEKYPTVAGVLVEPTNDLIGTIFLATCYEFLDKWGISYAYKLKYKGLPSVLVFYPDTQNETLVFLRSADRPERLVGFKVGWVILDEADQFKPDVYARILARKRDRRIEKMGGVRQTIAAYTPEVGFNWTYKVFHLNRTPDMHVIEGVSTKANKKNPTGYFDELVAGSLDDGDIARQTEGRRSSRNGLVYRRFSNEVNLGVHPDPWRGDVQLWCDFNNSKMVWVWVTLVDGLAYVFDELVREDTDTDEMAHEASLIAARAYSLRQVDERTLDALPIERWPVSPFVAARRVTVIGDAAGDHDAGAAGKVSYEILRQHGFQVTYKKSNPLIDDTVLTVNMALADGWIKFDEQKAKYTTTCIRQQPYGPDGKPLKGAGSREKVKAGLDHGADCIRYGVWYHRPVHCRRGNQERG